MKGLRDPLVKGHPLHAILTDLPIGTTVAAAAFDALALAGRSPRWRFAADASVGASFAFGSAAALVGLWDYQAVPREHPARRTGALHGYLNAGVLGLLGASLLARLGGPSDDGVWAPQSRDLLGSALALGALGLLGASGWLGGDLVYRLGWRVAPAERDEQLESALHERGDDALIAQARATVEGYERDHALLP